MSQRLGTNSALCMVTGLKNVQVVVIGEVCMSQGAGANLPAAASLA